jgi:hypothetical protein
MNFQGRDLWSEEVRETPAQWNYRKYFRIWESLRPVAGTFKLQYKHTTRDTEQGNCTVLLQQMHVKQDVCHSDSQVLFSRMKQTRRN